MLILKKVNTVVFVVTILTCLQLFSPKPVVAMTLFFDGEFTELDDINTPNDSYFGGVDSAVTRFVVKDPTLIIKADKEEFCYFNAAYGGGRSVPGIPNIIDGNVSLILANPRCSLIVGGSLSQSHATIKGSISVSVEKPIPINIFTKDAKDLVIYGGCKAEKPGNTQFIDGSIRMTVSEGFATKLCGLGDAPGLAPNFIAVKKNVRIKLFETSIKEVIVAGENKNVNLGGDAFLTTEQSSIYSHLWGTKDGNINGSLNIDITKRSFINDFNITQDGTIAGPININIADSFVAWLRLGPSGNAAITTPVTATISGPGIDDEPHKGGGVAYNCICGPGEKGTFLNSVTLRLLSGNIINLYLGSNHGFTNQVNFSMRDGFVREMYIGATENLNVQHVSNIIADIGGGTIKTMFTGKCGFSVLNFVEGGTSKIVQVKNAIKPNNAAHINALTFYKDAKTVWGTKNETFELDANTVTLHSGSRFSSSEGAKIMFFVGDLINVDDSTFAPRGLKLGSQAPLALTGGEHSHLNVTSPMNVDLSFSPELMWKTHVPIATVSPTFAAQNLFNKRNSKGLLWDECEFDQTTNTWYSNNIQPSQDFYALSAAREASNWLRKQMIWNNQNRASKVLEQGLPGVWIDVQGGYEKLDTVVGKSKMPWLMACMGYDALQPVADHHIKTLYGFSFGLCEGHDKWSTVNNNKNAIYTGMLDGYCGLMHDSGLYGTATMQLAACKITAKSPGFDLKHTWTDVAPTEAIELGWKYAFGNGFKISPRGQIIFEELSKHRISMTCGDDTETLNGILLTTMSLGLTGEYSFQLPVPTNFQASVEWIKGLSGDFGVTSKVLKKKFNDKNDSSIVRTTVGITSQIGEQIDVQCNVFADAGDNKGIGGQVNVVYAF